MRKHLTIVLALLISLVLVACEGSPALPEGNITSTSISPEPSPEETMHALERTSIDNVVREQLYKNFLTNNYNDLSSLMPGGISGIGFIDLDLDGGMEMLLFDAGASASMGLQFFDIIDGEVRCVSANIVDLGERFGGDYLRETYVNANYFDDFRLMTDKKTGDKRFVVESANGALDFGYNEQISFSADGEILTLSSLCYQYQSFDNETGTVTGTKYTVGGADCEKDAYDAAVKSLKDDYTDANLECKGVFLWEDDSYAEGASGLIAMADKALSLAGDQIDLY